MIKILKLQKGLIFIILGVIAIITYAILVMQKSDNSQYALVFSGILFILGSLMLLYPILTARKDKDGVVQLDKAKAEIAEKEEENEAAELKKRNAKRKAEANRIT